MYNRLFAGLLAATLFLLTGQPGSAADGDKVGKVLRLKSIASAVQAATPRPLHIGADIMVGDVISTGKDTRLEFSLKDGSTVTLGADTTFAVDDFSDAPARESIAMRMLTGAFAATSGRIAAINPDAMTVSTAVATIGIRGTTVWGGRLTDDFEVALLAGRAVRVTTQAGSVELTTVGSGTSIASGDVAPTAPVDWAPAKISQARATVEF